MKKIWALLFCLPLHGNYTYDLSICAIFRDEAPYLKEWIEFHKLVGVEHFYLFNNQSHDDYLSILQPYVDKGEVELFEWPIAALGWDHWINIVQPSAYQVGIEKARGVTKWLAIIDIDEFLTPTYANTVPEILKGYEEFGGVCFNWKIFGHSNWWILPSNKLMIEMLTMRAPDDRTTHFGIKSIVRPERVEGCHHPHYVIYKENFYHVTSNKDSHIDSQGIADGIYYDVLAINHYWSRHGQYFYKKLKRYAPWVPGIDPEKWQDYLKGLNVVNDSSMQRFISPLRAALL